MQAHPLKRGGFGYCPTLQKQEKEKPEGAHLTRRFQLQNNRF
jgi:hypothetical protein